MNIRSNKSSYEIQTSVFLLVGFCLSASSQTVNQKYDKLLANSLGGDDYGMKTYIFVILKTGPDKIEDKKVLDSLFKGHMENIGRFGEASVHQVGKWKEEKEI